MAAAEVQARSNSEHLIEQRFEAVAANAADFVHVYTSALLQQEASLATDRLSGAHVSEGELEEFGQDLDFGPMVLLDNRGRLLAVTPLKPSILGEDIAPHYAHLVKAEHGQANVSVVVASAAQHVPVVGFAVPFSTPYGRRVVSGAITISSTPLGIYLSRIYSSKTYPVYLVDVNGRVVSTTGRPAYDLTEANPVLSRALAHGRQEGDVDGVVYAAVPVPGTPWELVADASSAKLFHLLDGANEVLPWLYIAGFALLAVGFSLLFLRAWEDRHRMAVLANMDALTGAANRRGTEAALLAASSAAARHMQPLAVLIVDIDHFKKVNDTLGHSSGDEVLREVTDRLRGCLRAEDVLGRWGGEEFLAVLPFTGADGAAAVAERLRQAVSARPVRVDQHEPNLTVSIGVAVSDRGATPDELVSAADEALYRAKTGGRNRVEVSDPLLREESLVGGAVA
jgi:diguanylate cyclase (GGDEF)-like protein